MAMTITGYGSDSDSAALRSRTACTARASCTVRPLRFDPASFDISAVDIDQLACIGEKTKWSQLSQTQIKQLSPEAQERYSSGAHKVRVVRAKCKSTVVYLVFPPRAPNYPLPMCNHCFNEYFESHEIEAEMVMRLSDDEDDFTTGDNRSKKRRKMQRSQGCGNGNGGGSGNGNGNGSSLTTTTTTTTAPATITDSDINPDADPICQVPRLRTCSVDG